MLNPKKKIAESKGIDIPIMYVYLAGRIAGNCIDKCLSWRNKIINHYTNYKLVDTNEWEICPNCGGNGRERYNDDIYCICEDCAGCGTIRKYEYTSYPISFLDALNSKESDSVDEKGLTSAIPSNLIYSKDMLSVKKSDVIVANMEDYMEEGIKEYLISYRFEDFDNAISEPPNFDYIKAYNILKETIINRRANYGTTMEVAWGLFLQKPVILIAGNKERKELLEKHPFTKRASVIVENVEELLEKKWLQILYKSISSAIY